MSKTARVAKPSAVIVDIDGTLAIITDRNPYSHKGVLKDKPNAPLIAVARALAQAGHTLVIVSGRSELARGGTERGYRAVAHAPSWSTGRGAIHAADR